MFRRLRWRIALPYVALILVATLGLTLYISNQVRQVRMEQIPRSWTNWPGTGPAGWRPG
jgi:hypothetical protein